MRRATTQESILIEGLKELSLSPSDDQVRAFITYLNELKRWNRAYNLTGLRSDEEIIVKHFLDSLLYLEGLPDGKISVMDVGSGAGFPGIPLKIMRPEIMMYLLEPSRKKSNFLIHIIKTLGLDNIEVIEKRIEEARSLIVDAAVTRALFDVAGFYKKTLPHLREGGRLILNKGPKVAEELNRMKGLKYELLPLKLPVSSIKRFIVIIKKEASGETDRKDNHRFVTQGDTVPNVCVNLECRLRKAGCRGFEGCPGYKARS